MASRPPNPYAQYAQPAANPYAVYSTPAQGPKPGTGFRSNSDGTQSYIQGGGEDPLLRAQQAGSAAAAVAAVQASKERELANYRMQLALTEDAEKRRRDDQAKRDKPLEITPEARAKAIEGFKTAERMAAAIKVLQGRFAEGPGSTSGLSGLKDLLPTDANARFETAANALRGDVGQALAFTGGQLNTPAEVAAAIGPYLPTPGDRDSVIRDKIANLQRLAQNAQERSVAQLGGVPTADGRIQPLASPRQEVATGATRNEPDPKASALIDSLARRGASADEINAAIAPFGLAPVSPEQVKAVQDFAGKNPGYQGSYGSATRPVENTLLNRASASPFAAATTGTINGLTAGLFDEGVGAAQSALTGAPIDESIAQADRAKQAMFQNSPVSAFAGNLVGGAGSMLAGGAGLARLGATAVLGRAAPVAGDLAYGALAGAGETNDNRLLGAGIGAGAGLVGRGLTSGATRMFGRGLRGSQNADARYLAERGVPLTGGDILGGGVKAIEDKFSSAPGVGDLINARQLDSFRGFNRAAFDEGLAPAGRITNPPAQLNTGGVTGEQGIDLARGIRGQAYRNTLDPVNLQIDRQFGSDYGQAMVQGRGLTADMADRARVNLNLAGQNFDQGGSLPGGGFQQAVRRFRRATSQNAPLPNGDDLGNVMRAGEDAFTGLLDRQAPGVLPDFNTVNGLNRNVEVLRGAVTRARNGSRSGEAGLFTPSQLADEASSNARRFGGTQGTTQQPFFDLARAGQNILPSSVPDSGTAGRLAALALPGAVGGGAAAGGGLGYTLDDAKGGATAGGLATIATLAASGALNTAAGRQALARLLLERGPAATAAGNYLVGQGSRRAGMFGRSAGTALLPFAQ